MTHLLDRDRMNEFLRLLTFRFRSYLYFDKVKESEYRQFYLLNHVNVYNVNDPLFLSLVLLKLINWPIFSINGNDRKVCNRYRFRALHQLPSISDYLATERSDQNYNMPGIGTGK